MTPSNRICPIVLSLPHPRFWACAESLFLPHSGPAEPTRLSTHHPGRTRSPHIRPIRQWDTPRYHLGGLTFFPVSPFFLHAPPTRTNGHAQKQRRYETRVVQSISLRILHNIETIAPSVRSNTQQAKLDRNFIRSGFGTRKTFFVIENHFFNKRLP